jgi:hypothetical protein
VASSPDPGRPEIPHIKTPTFKNAPRPILGQLNDRPVAMKLDQPAAIDGPTADPHHRDGREDGGGTSRTRPRRPNSMRRPCGRIWPSSGSWQRRGREGLKQLLAIIADEKDARLPIDARASLIVLAAQLQALQTMIGAIERRIMAQHRATEASKRVATIPGIGVLGASAITATVSDPSVFRPGRDFAAWIGLVPRQDSTGGKQKLGPISKQGDRYLRRILVVGAHSVLKRAKQSPEKYPWLTQLLARRPFKVVAIALAKQDGARRLGAVGQGWNLSGAGARGSLRRGIRWEDEVTSVRYMNCKG